MRRRLSDFVNTSGIYSRNRIRRSGIAREKFLAGHFLRQQRIEFALELFDGNIRKIAATVSCRLRDDAMTHKGAGAYRRIIGPTHGVPLSGVDSPELNSARHMHRLLQFCGLAE